MNALTPEQETIVSEFASIVNYHGDLNQIIPFLQNSNWELEPAIISYFESNPDANEALNNESRVTASNNDGSPSSNWSLNSLSQRFNSIFSRNSYSPLNNGNNPPEQTFLQEFKALPPREQFIYVMQVILYIPFLIIYKVSVLVFYLITKLFPFIRTLTTKYTQNRHGSRSEPKGIDSSDVARNFILEFNNYYARNLENKINFFEGGYTNALFLANKDARLMIVYLHSDEHEDTDKFVLGTLLDDKFIKFLNDYNILIWGGNVKESESYQISNALGVTKYPFIGLMSLKTTTNQTPEGTTTSAPTLGCICKIQGTISADKLIDKLSSQIERVEPMLIAIRAERQEQELSRVIRQQQDQAYQESLLRDQQREQNRVNVKNWLNWKLSVLVPEEEERGEFARISIRLSNGERIIRNFNKNCSVEDIYTFIELKNKNLLGQTPSTPVVKPPADFSYEFNFKLFSSFPRSELEPNPNELIKDQPAVWPNGNLIMEESEE